MRNILAIWILLGATSAGAADFSSCWSGKGKHFVQGVEGNSAELVFAKVDRIESSLEILLVLFVGKKVYVAESSRYSVDSNGKLLAYGYIGPPECRPSGMLSGLNLQTIWNMPACREAYHTLNIEDLGAETTSLGFTYNCADSDDGGYTSRSRIQAKRIPCPGSE
jgi:hypothetical protein